MTEALAPNTIAVVRQAAAILLCYPDAAFLERFPLVRSAVAELPAGPARTGLARFCAYVDRAGGGGEGFAGKGFGDTAGGGGNELELGARYVRTFDLKRRRALHLTYYTDGDTRRRGQALARVKEVYRASGWELDAAELPDHLAVVLEFAARGDRDQGERLLRAFQPGIELLRAALEDCPDTGGGAGRADVDHGLRDAVDAKGGTGRTALAGDGREPRSGDPRDAAAPNGKAAFGTRRSPYADVLDAVAATLPPPDKARREAARIAAAGPPAEDVGLDPYGATADSAPAKAPVPLGMPVAMGGGR